MKITVKVAAVIVNKKDEVLLIKERYEAGDRPKWNLIKGTFDSNNETLEDCVVREIKEEVGLKAKNPVLKEIFHYGNLNNHRILFVFFVNKFIGKVALDLKEKQNSREENISDFKWFSKKEISKMHKEEFMSPYVYLSLKNYKNNSKINITKI
jgi:8-oxo-dGTP pyrophosphatase MutT (NUDIX family)